MTATLILNDLDVNKLNTETRTNKLFQVQAQLKNNIYFV